jgi:hypothetical protein
MYTHIVPNGYMVLDNRMAANTYIVTNTGEFPHQGAMTGLEILAGSDAGIYYSM